MITTILVEFPHGDEVLGQISIASLPEYIAIEKLQRDFSGRGIMVGAHFALCVIVVYDQQPVSEIFEALDQILPEYVLNLPMDVIESLNFEQNIVKFTA